MARTLNENTFEAITNMIMEWKNAGHADWWTIDPNNHMSFLVHETIWKLENAFDPQWMNNNFRTCPEASWVGEQMPWSCKTNIWVALGYKALNLPTEQWPN